MPCTKALAALVKQECANYSAKLGGCVYGGPCSVLDGSPCKIKFITANVSGITQLPAGYDYVQVSLIPFAVMHKPEHLDGARDYAAMIGEALPPKRMCDCGAELPARKRMCA